MWTADGNTSLDDCEALTWSFGCTGRPSRWLASRAITSLTFMFVEVPDPVWKTGDREVAVILASVAGFADRHLVGGVADRAGHVRVDHAELGVDRRGRGLDPGERDDHGSAVSARR